MRTEVTRHPRNKVCRRENYIRDLNGKHKAKGLDVHVEWLGASSSEEFRRQLVDMSVRPQGRGAPIKHYAIEVSVHPKDANGARRPFRNLGEMQTVAHALIKQLHIQVGVLGCHGLQDLHILGLNFGLTGLSLRSYVPNRSNLRRVAVAVADRVEREINERREKDGHGKLIPVSEVREEDRKKAGRRKRTEVIAERLDLDKDELTVPELLKAFRKVKMRAAIDGSKLLVSSVGQKKASSYELDLFMRGVWKELLARRERENTKKKDDEDKRQKAELVPYELLTSALIAHHRGWKLPKGIEGWLRVEPAGVVELPALKSALLKDFSAEKEEYVTARGSLDYLSKGAVTKDYRDI